MKQEQPEMLAIGDDEYRWAIRHSWLVDGGSGLKGLSVSVWREPGCTRELIIDFPFPVFGLDRSPKRAALIIALRSAIQAAIIAGWDPESRGRTFRFKVPEQETSH